MPEIVAECVRRHVKRPLAEIGFLELDQAATEDPVTKFGRIEPALSSFIVSNVDGDALRRVLSHVAIALHNAAGYVLARSDVEEEAERALHAERAREVAGEAGLA